MQIAAILTVPAKDGPRQYGEDDPRTYSTLDLLGASLLDRTQIKLNEIGALPPKILADANLSRQVFPSHSVRSNAYVDAWEGAVAAYINGGVDLLLLVRVGDYADVNYDELLGFHAGTKSPLTQVYGADGSLDIAVVDAALLRDRDDLVRRALSHLIPRQRRFHYSGYINRLRRPQDLHRLMQDGLEDRCGLRPAGNELLPGVWAGDGAEIDESVKIRGPVFVGRRARLAAGCTLVGPTSIEQDCQIDCASLIEESLVLEGSYVGVALDVRRAIVDEQRIFNLDRNVEVNISDARLLGRSGRSGGIFSGLASLLRGEAPLQTE